MSQAVQVASSGKYFALNIGCCGVDPLYVAIFHICWWKIGISYSFFLFRTLLGFYSFNSNLNDFHYILIAVVKKHTKYAFCHEYFLSNVTDFLA